MDIESYSVLFTRAAKENGYDDEYVARCLGYAKVLISNNLPVIYSLEHLALLTGIDEQYLRSVAYSQDRFYREFSIQKKSGKTRSISEPLPNLKIVQRWILEKILNNIPVSPFAKGFVKERSIKEAARFHRKQPKVLSLDISNFFESINSPRVNSIFRECGYSKKLSYFLTRLCTHCGALPQGAPTSPALSNIVFRESDAEISDYCKGRGLRYTRYADDMSFSGDLHPGEMISFIRRVLRKKQLKLNEEKTRLMKPHERQEVTGIVVNKKLQAPRPLRRQLRQEVHYIERFGLDVHLARINEMRPNYINHLKGIANFVLYVNPSDKEAQRALEVLRSLHQS